MVEVTLCWGDRSLYRLCVSSEPLRTLVLKVGTFRVWDFHSGGQWTGLKYTARYAKRRHFRSSHALGSASLSSAPPHLHHSGPQQSVSGPRRAGIAVRAEGGMKPVAALTGCPLQWFTELITPPPTVAFSVVVQSLSRVLLFAASWTEAH